ncbi:MAG: hypothetical protein FJX54_22495 [Alphaproteobacteria bacterium]|nr:hypothetical protein [Alphaproteobacteria bacterium]
MSALSHISALDRGLAARGEDVVLRRISGSGATATSVDVACRAVVREYRPEELVGGIAQGDSQVILSPSEIRSSGWPDPGGSPPGTVSLPKKGDKLIVQGRMRTIEAVAPILVAGEFVRIDLQVRG